jgi:large subunit ribosomal protein L31
MKKHAGNPEWCPNCSVYCDGQLVMKVASTKKSVSVDAWSGNHPVYTGAKMFLDVEGRIEKFRRKYDTKWERPFEDLFLYSLRNREENLDM